MSYNNSNNTRRTYGQDRRNGEFRCSRNDNRGWTISLTAAEAELVNRGKDELFDKNRSFSIITSLKDNSLLSSENLFKTDRWEIKKLLLLKQQLNDTRNRLNEKDIKVWKQHTRKTNMTKDVVYSLRNQNSIQMCTNAWIKMAEIFSKYTDLIPKDLPDDQSFRTVHVCEAPGAFICATNFYLNQRYEKSDRCLPRRQWEWTGLSLNPYYEGNDQETMVDDDRFIVETLDRWYFGKDNSGNILDINNIKGLWEKVRLDPKSTGVHLVTGDGSVDTSGDPNEQESIVSELHYSEAICAMGVLMKGGSLVLKMFSLFECETVCLLYILALHFKYLSIFKPASSRAPNGETYVVALGFRGIDPDTLHSLLSFVSPTFPAGKALLSYNSIPQSFLDELIKIADYFTMKQIQALERNLQLEQFWNANINKAITRLNEDVVKEFRRRCSIDYNYKQYARIVTNVELDGSAKASGNSAAIAKGGLRERSGGTLEDRNNRKRTRNEFLSGNDDNADDDISDETLTKKPRRENLVQVKSVIAGQHTSTKFTSNDIIPQMDVDLSSNPHEESASESKSMKMMKKSGYVEGQGLGAHNQGRSTPIETVIIDSRLGLGHHKQPTTASSSSSGVPRVFDEPFFTSYVQPISSNSSSLLRNFQTTTLGSNLHSVISSLFVKFLDLESLYKKREEYVKNIKDKNFQKLKIFISDQLELLNKEERYKDTHGHYMNYHTAYQLASLDKIFKLTSMELDDSKSLSFIIDNESLSGFAEYLIWQQNGHVNGLIISDLRIPFPTSSSVIFGSQIDPNHPKVHLFFSDLSIIPNNVKINSRYYEQYNKRQFIISCRRALVGVDEGGHFVCKILDTLTRFTAGLIYLLYRSFKLICILRPFTLDPASSERFLVCQQLKYPIDLSIVQHLDELIQYEKIENILEVVPLECLLDRQFQRYIAYTSQLLLQTEIQALDKRLWYNKHKNDQQVNLMIAEEHWLEAHENVTVSRRPKPSLVEPDSGITLPIGWTKEWSNREERFYYYNRNTHESRWDPPI